MSDTPITADNIYQEVPKRDPDDEDLLRHADEAQGVAIRLSPDIGGPYKLAAVGGTVWWFLGTAKGTGSADTSTATVEIQGSGSIVKQGAGFFRGPVPDVAEGITDGEYTLTVTATTVELKLTDSDADTFNGTGVQRGLTGVWRGTWTK